MLAVDIDEDVARLAQQLHGDRLAVEVGARAAIVAHDAAHEQLAVRAHRLLLEPLFQFPRRAAQIESAGDFRALGAVAHDLRAGAAAGEQLQRIDQDRFARAGLPGEDREPRAQLQFHRIDDGEVTDLQVREHEFLALEAAAAPVELRAQQPVVVVAGRVQQRGALFCGAHLKAIRRR